LDWIASNLQEFEALRAALKAKEAAESRAAAISRGSFKTSALPSANFTPLNSYENTVGANPVNISTLTPRLFPQLKSCLTISWR